MRMSVRIRASTNTYMWVCVTMWVLECMCISGPECVRGGLSMCVRAYVCVCTCDNRRVMSVHTCVHIRACGLCGLPSWGWRGPPL